MLCEILFHFYNLKKVKNNDGAVLLLVEVLAEVCNLIKSKNPSWVFFTNGTKLRKASQIEFIKPFRWISIIPWFVTLR